MNPFVTEARALCRDATDGPWHAGRADMGTFVDGYESKWIYAGEPAEKSKYLAVSSGYEIKEWGEVMANARLIARSRTLLPEMAAEIERLERELSALTADIEAGRLVRLRNCDECRYKLQSEAWKYYRYPCTECRQRVKDHFAEAEALAAMEEGNHES